MVGSNASILGNVKVADDCKIGSSAVLVHDVPPGTTIVGTCLLYTSPSPRDATLSRMPSSA